jgi:hypothetical protein
MIEPESEQVAISGGGDGRFLHGPSTVEDEEKIEGTGPDLGIRPFIGVAEGDAVVVQDDQPSPPPVHLSETQATASALELPHLRRELHGGGQVGQKLVDTVSGDGGLNRRFSSHGQLHIDPMDRRLMELASRPKSNVLVRSPCPHLGVGVIGAEGGEQIRSPAKEPRCAGGSMVQVHGIRGDPDLGALPDQMLGPAVDLAQVGGDVADRPTGARGNRCQRVGRMEHPRTASDLLGQCRAMFKMLHETLMLSVPVIGTVVDHSSDYAEAEVRKVSALVLVRGMTRLGPSSLWAVKACPAGLVHVAPE